MTRTAMRARSSVLLVFVLVHVPLFVYQLHRPDAWLAGDRATQRLETIERFGDLVSTGAMTVTRFVELGPPGDYLQYALAYHAGGQVAVVLLQLVLQWVSLLFFYRAALVWMERPAWAALATVMLVLTNAWIYHPHVLATESIFNSLLTIATCALLERRGALRDRPLGPAFALFAVAILVRNQFVLFPLCLIAVLAVTARAAENGALRVPRAARLLLVAYAPLILWLVLTFAATGRLAMNASEFGLRYNLYGRAERMSRFVDLDVDARAAAEKRLSPAAFMSIVAAHPFPFARTIAVDTIHLGFNPGTNSTFGHFLRAYAAFEDRGQWRRVLDEQGVLAFVRLFLKSNVFFVVVTLLGTGAVTALWLLAGFGAARFITDSRFPGAEKALVFAFLVYTVATSYVAAAVRWEHRSQFEFMLVLLATLSLQQRYGLWRARRRDPSTEPRPHSERPRSDPAS